MRRSGSRTPLTAQHGQRRAAVLAVLAIVVAGCQAASAGAAAGRSAPSAAPSAAAWPAPSPRCRASRRADLLGL
jgi:hypothetical protein